MLITYAWILTNTHITIHTYIGEYNMNMGNNIQSVEQDNPVTTHSSTIQEIDSVLEKFRYLRNELKTLSLESCEYNFNNAKQTYGLITRICERMDDCYENK